MTNDNKPGDVLEVKVKDITGRPLEQKILDKAGLELQLSSTFTERVLEFCARGGTQSEYSVILFDVDYFKAINDLLGHQRGDDVLADIIYLLEDYAKSQEMIGVLGKKGGEEFLIALPYASSRIAGYIADELRQLVHDHCFDAINSDETSLLKRVTISLGVNTVGLDTIVSKIKEMKSDSPRKMARNEIETLLEGADIALSMSKYLGRNTVQVFRQYLADEKKNLDAVRTFYFRNAWKKPCMLQPLFNDNYFANRRSILKRVKKHFYFARTELDPRDTRTAALLADNMYRLVSLEGDCEKKSLVGVARKYSQKL